VPPVVQARSPDVAAVEDGRGVIEPDACRARGRLGIEQRRELPLPGIVEQIGDASRSLVSAEARERYPAPVVTREDLKTIPGAEPRLLVRHF